MSVQNGDVLILNIGGVQVGALLSNSFNAAADMLDATTKDSAGAKEYISGEYGWGMSFESLYDPAATEGFSEALGYVKAGTSLDVYWGGVTAADIYYNGAALMSSVDLSGPKNEVSSYSGELQGTGVIAEGVAS
jgi:hypothetical protein